MTTFEGPDLKVIVDMQIGLHLQKELVKFVYEGHRVDVKVTAAKKPKARVVCLRLKGDHV